MNTIPSRSPSTRRAGFTLVELLVVIGIIALLISILLPALNKARSSAQQTACLSQLKQLGIAITMYANDNRGAIIPPTHIGNQDDGTLGRDFWYHMLAAGKYLPASNSTDVNSLDPKTVLVCPSIRDKKATTGDTDGWEAQVSQLSMPGTIGYAGYVINGQVQPRDDASGSLREGGTQQNYPSTMLSTRASQKMVRLKKITQFKAAETVILLDGWSYNIPADFKRITGARHGRWLPSKPTTSGTTNVLFLDGHAVPAPREDLPQVDAQYSGTRAQMKNPDYVFNLRQKQ